MKVSLAFAVQIVNIDIKYAYMNHVQRNDVKNKHADFGNKCACATPVVRG